MRKKLLADFERLEIQLDAVIPFNADAVKSESMCHHYKEVETRARLRGVMGDAAWATWGA